MSPFELTATPDASPKFMSGGSLKKFGAESNGISGAGCCAIAAGISATTAASAAARPQVFTVVTDPPPCVKRPWCGNERGEYIRVGGSCTGFAVSPADG